MVEFPQPHCTNKKTDTDIDEREREGLDRPSQISEFAAFGEKKSVENHFKNKQPKQYSHFERQVPSRRPACRTRQSVATAKLIAFGFEIAKMSTKAVKLIATLSGFGVKLANGGWRGLPNGREPSFEVETGQPLLVYLQFVQEHTVGAVLLGFNVLDNAILDVVKAGRIRRRFISDAPARAGFGKRHIGRKPLDVQRRKYFQ